MSDDLSEFHDVFFEEADELVETMEAELLDMLSDPDDPERINTVFRAAHSIKGGSATFGFDAVAKFTHVMETLMDEVRDGERRAEPDLVDLLLRGTDCVRSMLEAAKQGVESDAEVIDKVMAQLQACLEGGSPGGSADAGSKPDEAAAAASAASDSDAASENDDQDSAEGSDAPTKTYQIYLRAAPNSLRTANDPLALLAELESMGELTVELIADTLPSIDELVPEELYFAWNLTLQTPSDKSDIFEVFDWLDDASELKVEEIAASSVESAPDSQDHSTSSDSDAPDQTKLNAPKDQGEEQVVDIPKQAKAPAAAAPKPAAKTSAASSIRVGIDKIDKLINLVGELVITQSMLTEEGSKLPSESAEKLHEGLSQLQRYTRELQENVMQIRMVPISNAFNRLPRMIHDLTSKLGKKIDLKMVGEQTELDKTVLESIGDPLVHLVRNAVDHGIEMPDERVAAGKPETGEIQLNAYHESGNIIIEIVDDGGGINCEKVLGKAKERGLVGSDERLEDSEVFDLLFHPGFSTAEQVSDVSGRGVGMDVVKRNIQALGGAVEVDSKLGEGSVFRISLPLTLAIIDGQLVRVGDQTFVLPLTSIVESIQLDPQQVSAVAGKGALYRLRHEYMPLVQLANLFALSKGSNREQLVVVVESDSGKVGLLVDDLLAQQQVVIKSLEANYRSVEGIAGATILGDGTVALILDIDGVNNLSKTTVHRLTQSQIQAA